MMYSVSREDMLSRFPLEERASSKCLPAPSNIKLNLVNSDKVEVESG